MDESAVRRIVTKHLPRMKRKLCLWDWRIDTTIGSIDRDPNIRTSGRIFADPKYKRATMQLDPEELESEEEVLIAIRHELLHLVHADLEILRSTIAPFLREEEFKSTDALISHVAERIVNHLEYMIEVGFGLDVFGDYPKPKRRKKRS